MNNGWTGGQYSLYRALLGISLLIAALLRAPEQPLALLAVPLGVLLAIGWYDRLAAGFLLAAGIGWGYLDGPAVVGCWPFIGLLLIHLATAAAPYGSWAARGRVDPGNGWTLSPTLYFCAWLWLCFAVTVPWLPKRGELPLVILIVVSAWIPSLRVLIWWLTLLTTVVLGGRNETWALPLLNVLTFDPAWIPPRGTATERLFYDGNCGLCHRAVRFVLAEDRTGTAFRFAPLDSDALRAALSDEQRNALPDSLVVLTADGVVLTRWRGMGHIAQRLGGLWRLLGLFAALVPEAIGNSLYDGLARLRHRLFTKPHDACPILPSALRQRFDW